MDRDTVTLVAALSDLSQEREARGVADAVEFRMDLAEGDPLEELRRYAGELPVVVTNRVIGEGGQAPDDPSRLEVLAEAATFDSVWAVDVELASLERGEASQVTEAAGGETAVIASAHDFEAMPPLDEAQTLLEAACTAGDIGKVAFQANTHRDAVEVLQLAAWASSEDLRATTIAMGEAGRHTRAVAPVYGSRLTYAPIHTDASTAPGQYDLSTLASLLELV